MQELRDYIHRYAPDATALLHETWECRVDDPRFYGNFTEGRGTEDAGTRCIQGLSSAYDDDCEGTWGCGACQWVTPFIWPIMIRSTGAIMGRASRSIRKQAKPGELPDQTHSLNMGWQWKEQNGAKKLVMDGHHANMAGEYLGACVWFEVMFGKSVVDNSFVPAGLDAEYAKFLRETAHRAVEEAK